MRISFFKLLLFCGILNSIISGTTFGKLSIQNVYAFFGAYVYETTIDKEYQLENPGTLIINNRAGNITITTEWKRNTIRLRAIKQSNKEEDLPLMLIKEQTTPQLEKKLPSNLTLTTGYAHDRIKGRIHYELIVPAAMIVNVTTEYGTIYLHNISGPVTATTVNGNIDLFNTNNTITAQTKQNGSITITQARGAIQATTNYGTITINDATNNIVATTTKGTITTLCTQIPDTSDIMLKSSSGSIALQLPKTANVHIHGKTERGSIRSDHYITLNQQTTKLNEQTWKKFKKEINGTIGTAKAKIELQSTRGNIKILETIA